jgi:hypothetical protein
MRTIKELLILLREELPKRIVNDDSGSICWTLGRMENEGIITQPEFNVMDFFIDSKEPENAGYFKYDDCGGFWWPYGELAPRLEFLDKLIAEIDEN